MEIRTTPGGGVLVKYLHGGDVLEEVFDATRGIPIDSRALKGQQREEFLVVGFVAIDLAGRTGARRRTVEHRTQIVLEHAEEEQPPPPTYPRRRGDEP
ncbi:hypothetical protein NHX12_002739 [Muraenolepis orangiensis]|uniref:Uncharacterized protein n=1 Tax=Muraenolepis orangiensis TaxID=630683 RepID=A0A9Q0E014_9TELE|nr:hypothetical protein NHX12_002739 [Muraenolepis orangiensis]